jgi:Xaa-Pro aminopeptidase
MNELTGQILIAGSPQSDTDIRYLSNFTAPDPFVFLKTASWNYLLVSPMEKGRAESQSKKGVKVFTPAELGLSPKQSGRTDLQIIALMEMAGVRRIKVPSAFPVGVFRSLKSKGIKVSVLDEPVCPQRSIKDRSELMSIRASQRAAVAAMDAGISLIASARIDQENRLRNGDTFLTSESVRRLIHKTLIDHDCTGIETIVAGGDQATDPHERGHGPLYAGQSIIIDIFPRSEKTGYWGDITRTVCRGPASPKLKKMYLAVKAAQAAALRLVQPGICADLVHKAAQQVFTERGYETTEIEGRNVGFIQGTGHGVGLEIQERPRVGKSGEKLAAGNVITVEPGLYYPGLGGIRIEDTVVVTENGWRYLATYEKKFELL